MTPPEQPVEQHAGHVRADRQPLYLRMYFQSHLSAVVQSIGYQQWPLDTARAQLTELEEQFGAALIQSAEQELLTMDHSGSVPTVRLSDDARRLARMLLGPPPRGDAPGAAAVAPSTTEDPVPTNLASNSADRSPPKRPASRNRRKTSPRRAEFLKRFAAWLTEQGEDYSIPNDDHCGGAPAHPLRDVDFIVRRNEQQLLVAVRRNLHQKQIASLLEAELHFGAGTTAIRVWPDPSADGWTWQKHPIVASDSPSQSE